ncbi:MAG: metallophosphoesterase [Firmicutes bacterium]|nr:metallophosphoesterase [Bacillota bacterium]
MNIKVGYGLIVFLIVLIIIGVSYNIWINTRIQLTEISISSTNIPGDLKGLRVVQVSDFHNEIYGKDQSMILEKLKESNPDVILITGDLIDRRNTQIDIAVDFVREAIKLAPIYFVSGNHEGLSGDYELLKSRLITEGVKVLDNETIFIKVGQSSLKIAGIVDPCFYEGSDDGEIVSVSLASIEGESADFSILLAHRPDLFEVYAKYDYDLIFSGHAHGGQFRFPFIGGLLAPDQGLFPKYDSGLYRLGKTTMIVSRGLGNSLFPFRLFNGPELIVVEL